MVTKRVKLVILTLIFLLIPISIFFHLTISNYFPLSLLSTAGYLTNDESRTIRISAVSGEALYNVSVIKLEKNTTYTIVFSNPDPTPHNLVIAVDGRRINTALDAAETDGDLILGPTANDNNPVAPRTWSMEWTTPNEDKYVIFFCSFVGHFEKGMHGYFQIGNPQEQPPTFQAKASFIDVLGIMISLSSIVMVKTMARKGKKSQEKE